MPQLVGDTGQGNAPEQVRASRYWDITEIFFETSFTLCLVRVTGQEKKEAEIKIEAGFTPASTIL